MGSLSDTAFLQIQSYSEHPEVYRMADLIVDSYLQGKSRSHRQKYLRPAKKLVASMWCHPSSFFRFSTSAEHYGAKRKQVWMSHEVLTLFKHMRDMDPPMFNQVHKAIPPAFARDGVGKSAIYCKSWYFTNTLKGLTEKDIYLDPDIPRITLKSADDFWLPIPEEEKSQSWYLESERILKEHSEFLSKAEITLSDGSPMPRDHYVYFRRFKGSFKTTGRLYSTFETYPKIERLGIQFGGVSAVSIDITAFHPTLLLRIFYRLKEETAGMFSGQRDPYAMPWHTHLPRAVHKRVINVLLNSRDELSAIKCLLNMHFWYEPGNEEIKVEVYDGKKKRKGAKVFPGNSKEIRQYIESYKVFHPLFAPLIHKGASSALQKIDSDIMLQVLDLCHEAQIPVLPVHDEIVFPEPYLETLKLSFALAFREVLRDFSSFGNLSISISYKLDKNSRTNNGGGGAIYE